jgi:hypothetical protein
LAARRAPARAAAARAPRRAVCWRQDAAASRLQRAGCLPQVGCATVRCGARCWWWTGRVLARRGDCCAHGCVARVPCVGGWARSARSTDESFKHRRRARVAAVARHRIACRRALGSIFLRTPFIGVVRGGGWGGIPSPRSIVNFLIPPDFNCKNFSGPRRGGGGGEG